MSKKFTVSLIAGLVFCFQAHAQTPDTTSPNENDVENILASETLKLRRGITDDINAAVYNSDEEELKALVKNVNAYLKRTGAEDKIIPVTDIKDKDQMRRYLKKVIGLKDVVVNPDSLKDNVPASTRETDGKYTSRAAELLQ